MVKVSFQSALGQKDVNKDAETLLPEEVKDAEAAVPVRYESRAWCWCMFLGLALMLTGVLIGGVYLYHYYTVDWRAESHLGWGETETFHCHHDYYDNPLGGEVEVETPSQFPLRQLEESIRVMEAEQVELINVPVPEFENGDPAQIVHDFSRRLTAYLDMKLNKCYIIPLNTSIVMPPRDLLELLVNIKAGTYLPRSYLVHEEMIVTERLERVDQLGSFIYNLCRGKNTYKLQRRDRILGMQKREALDCLRIRHFESNQVVETLICEA